MNFPKSIITLFSFLVFYQAISQNTVGLISSISEESYDGYNLIYPFSQKDVFLIDNCGRLVHEWEGEAGTVPGMLAYLLENGNLIKAVRNGSSGVLDTIWSPGAGETVEIRNWENTLLHSFTLNDTLFRLHHDVEALPNGNILLIAWANKNKQEAIDAGRNPTLLSSEQLFSETIIEWNPSLDSIVWEWHAWDHLIQDFDDSKPNFGNVSSHAELINLNYDENNGLPSWLHCNSIDYNPVLDQIVLSIPTFNEFWIIDHSTTSLEAASDSGGNSGKGGDLLYRWGNPLAYNNGTEADKKLFFQHDVHWIRPNAQTNDEDFGVIAFFNNRVEGGSITNTMITSYNIETQQYELNDNIYEPLGYLNTYSHPSDDRSTSVVVSSIQILPNRNVLVFAGRWGFSYELNTENEVIWEYIIPIQKGTIVEQGTTLSINDNLSFRLKRYGLDFPAFDDKTLVAGDPLELNFNLDSCNFEVATINPIEEEIKIYPNPASKTLFIDKGDVDVDLMFLYDLNGQVVSEILTKQSQTKVELTNIPVGLYILKSPTTKAKKIIVY